MLLENPQDALFLQGPKPESEIDVPAAHVTKHHNYGSSGIRLIALFSPSLGTFKAKDVHFFSLLKAG